MNRRFLGRVVASLAAVWALAGAGAVHAADEAPDAMVQRLSTEVLDALRADKSIKAGDLDKVIALVDKTIMPNVNFRRMTAAAVGPGWRKASPEQQKRLQDEFKTLLVRTYAGALAQVSDQTINVKPLRASPEDKSADQRGGARKAEEVDEYREAEQAYAQVTRPGSGDFYQQALYKQSWSPRKRVPA